MRLSARSSYQVSQPDSPLHLLPQPITSLGSSTKVKGFWSFRIPKSFPSGNPRYKDERERELILESRVTHDGASGFVIGRAWLPFDCPRSRGCIFEFIWRARNILAKFAFREGLIEDHCGSESSWSRFHRYVLDPKISKSNLWGQITPVI